MRGGEGVNNYFSFDFRPVFADFPPCSPSGEGVSGSFRAAVSGFIHSCVGHVWEFAAFICFNISYALGILTSFTDYGNHPLYYIHYRSWPSSLLPRSESGSRERSGRTRDRAKGRDTHRGTRFSMPSPLLTPEPRSQPRPLTSLLYIVQVHV